MTGPLDGYLPPHPSDRAFEAEHCIICEKFIPPGEDRCTCCHLWLANDAPERPRPLGRSALWVMMGGVAAVYALTLLVAVIVD